MSGKVQSSLTDFEDTDTPIIKPRYRHFQVADGFVSHPLLRDGAIEAREFQLRIAEKALKGNLMVVLPTGLGKTIIAALVCAESFKRTGKKTVFLAPTKPLVNQHLETFQRLLEIERMAVLTGSIQPKERQRIWHENDVIFSTPQVVDNDTAAERYSIKDAPLIIVDEAHRAVGKYAYVSIIEREVMDRAAPLVLALTASPGEKRKRIVEVMKNLLIEKVEARGRGDPDVSPYVKDIQITWEKTRLSPQMVEIQKPLEDILYEKIEKLHKLGFLTYKKKIYVSKKDLITTGDQIRKRMGRRRAAYLFGALHNQAIAVHAYHCIELLETQGVSPLKVYLDRLGRKEEHSKSENALLKDKRMLGAHRLAMVHKAISHPKLDLLKKVVLRQFKDKRDSLVIVFAQYRDTISTIMKELEGLEVRPVRFVGQASRKGEKGLTQKEQKDVLDGFRKSDFNILVASSVAEEGLDIPSVDLVVFYEPIPSEIRAIQRRGRTGRSDIGKVSVLITEETRDEAYLYAEMSREKKMHRVVKWLSRK